MVIENLLSEILLDLVQKITGVTPKITVLKENETSYRLNVEIENAAMLIGYHGETMNALQHIFKALAFKKIEQEGINIVVDIDNYKHEHESNIIALAERKVDAARKTKKTQILPPMPAYLRRLIHMHLTQESFSDIQTESIGTDEHRQITIKIKES